MKEIVLALGGGGSKGYAHIGVLRALERHGFQVKAIAGTSAGGIIGSLYAYGYTPDVIQRRLGEIDAAHMYQREPDDPPSWLGVHGLRATLEEMLGDSTFEDLRMPFAVTAVDLDAAQLVGIASGSVVEAVLATIAVPGVFPPRPRDGRMLVDGGVLAPVPVGLARALRPDLPIVAVVLSPALQGWEGKDKPRLLNSLPFLAQYLARSRFTRAINIFLRSIDISGAMLTELLLAIEQPQVIIRPHVPQVGLLDVVDAPRIVALGEEALEAALPEIQSAVSLPARLGRLWRRGQAPKMRLPYVANFTGLEAGRAPDHRKPLDRLTAPRLDERHAGEAAADQETSEGWPRL